MRDHTKHPWAAALVAALALAGLCAGAPTAYQPCTVETIEAAMIRLKQPYVDDPVIADAAYRRTIAAATLAAAEEADVPALFLTGLFFRESSFRQAVLEGRRRGTRGEHGLGQLNGVAKWWCQRKGFDLRTADGQARCAAGWLDRCRRECDGSLEQGFARYATGRSCSPRFAGDVHRDRFALWRALETGGPIPTPPRRR
jgi:hypothetical protein